MRAVLFAVFALLSLPASALQHHLLIVSGIGGIDEYQRRFDDSALELYRAARDAGIAEDAIYLLTSAPLEGAPGAQRRSDLAGIRAALGDIRARAGAGDRVFVVLIGHGSPREDTALFNLPGPDLSAAELDRLLAPFDEQTLVIVNTASASGPFVDALSGDDRVVITATSSGREYFAVMFGKLFVDALAAPGADRDKDERISLLEAFDYARREVRRAYESEKRLLTEHALLDDNGDGVGSLDPGAFKADGALANRTWLAPPPQLAGGASPELLGMLSRKLELERSIGELKQQRDALERRQYYARLESLLLEFALLSRDIRARGD